MKRLVLIAFLLLLAAFASLPSAQMRVVPVDEERGHVALGLALRHLANTGIFMHTTAHPDDENNGLLVMLNRGQGFRTALATATRGNGGQNEIGPEIFEALGVLRTQELAALHRFDGAEQYFTRAVDFGYSFSVEETFEKWGKDEITGDYVRLMRTIRPDVVIGLMPGGSGGGQHHQASALITREAVKIAGDPTKYPEQIAQGLHPWQPRKFYYSTGFGFPGERPPTGKVVRINLAGYDPLLGRTYNEVGTEARSMHKCQGMAQLLSLPGPAASSYELMESNIPGELQKDETSLFDGVDTSVAGLAKFAGANPPAELTSGLAAVAGAVTAAQKKFDTDTDESTLKPILDGLSAVRALRRSLRGLSIDEAGKFDIDFRLQQKENEFQRAATLAAGVQVEALADDGVVVPGQSTTVSTLVANHGATPVTVKQITFDGFTGDAACTLTAVTTPQGFFGGRGRGRSAPAGPPVSTIAKDQVGRCEPAMKVPAESRITEPYWHRKGEDGRYTFDADAPFGLPYRPTPFRAHATLAFPGGEDVVVTLPVEHRYEGNIFSGEKRTELLVVPPFSARVSPGVTIIPESSIRSTAPPRTTAAGRGGRATANGRAGDAPSADREIRVTVVNDLPSGADSTVKLEAPAGWSVAPAEQPLKFARADESLTVRFQVRPAPGAKSGEYHLKAIVTGNGATVDRGYEVIEYPHIRRYHIYDPAETVVKVINVRAPTQMSVGYIMGVGDQVPPAIEQLGAKVEMIGPDDIAWGDLSRFDVIVTGVRAYERRDDLRANNSRLLDYVFNGGTVIVQYNKFEFNETQYGPYPAKVSSERVTDEFAAVQETDTHNPIFTTPNEISEATWKNWVQERGLYFLGDKDPRYHDLVQMEDPFANNKGVKTGALVEATYGKGKWVYVGLGLWRQLPAGTDGAYQLLANLIALGKKK